MDHGTHSGIRLTLKKNEPKRKLIQERQKNIAMNTQNHLKINIFSFLVMHN